MYVLINRFYVHTYETHVTYDCKFIYLKMYAYLSIHQLSIINYLACSNQINLSFKLTYNNEIDPDLNLAEAVDRLAPEHPGVIHHGALDLQDLLAGPVPEVKKQIDRQIDR